MTSKSEKTRDRILDHPAPRDIEWQEFITMWEHLADKVEQESGDRLAVDMKGHRKVFRRQHDRLVGIKDIELSRHLLNSTETIEGEGHLYTVLVTENDARCYDFDFNAHDVETLSTHHEQNPDSRGHHIRTVEKKTGRDDENDLIRFFEELVEDLQKNATGRQFVLLGHGTGKANASVSFKEYAEKHAPEVAENIIGVGDIDIDNSTETDIEKKAQEVVSR